MTLEQMLKKDLRMMFLSALSLSGEFPKAIRMIREIRLVPFGQVPFAIIIPADIVYKLKKRGLKMMTVLKPFNKADLTLEQIEDIRDGKAYVQPFYTFDFFVDRETLGKVIELSRKEYCKNKELSHGKTKKVQS